MRGGKGPPAVPRGVRTEGPIAVPNRAGSIGRALLADRGDLVDMGVHRGTRVPMSDPVAASLLGIPVTLIAKLVAIGALARSEEASPSGGRYVLVDPAWTTAEIHDAWAARRPMPVHHADVVPFEDVRRWCKLLDAHPYPEQLLEGIFRKLLEMGNFTRVETAVFLSLNSNLWPAVKKWMDARLGRFCARRGAARRVTLEMFRRSLPAVLRTAPRTCFEPVGREQNRHGGQEGSAPGDDHHRLEEDFGDHHRLGQADDADDASANGAEGRGEVKINTGREAPASSTRRRLWTMDELYVTASLHALIMAPVFRRFRDVDRYTGVFAKVETVLRQHAPDQAWSAETYLAAFRAYAIDQTILPEELPAVRYDTVRVFRIAIARLHRYLARQPQAFAKAARPLVAPRITLPFEFRKELRGKYGHLRIAGREERKKVSHKAMDELDLITTSLRNRRDEMRALGNAVRLEADAFGDDESHRDLGVKLPVLDARGALAGGEQTVWLRVWRCNDALASLGRKPLEDGVMRYPERKREGAPPIVRPKFIAEHLETVPVGASAKREPWMLELDRLGVTASFGKASPDRKEARHRAIVERNLPGHAATAAGTMNFDIWRGHIRRFGLEVGRHFPPIEQQEYGIRLAHHAFDCVNQSYNRAHEVRQQVRGGWRRIDLPPELLAKSREHWFRQDVIGKVPRWRDLAEMASVPLGIKETGYLEAIAITELHKRHAGLKRFPVMAPPEDFKWKCGPAQYVISSFGRTLTLGELQVPLWYLFDGWDDFTLHDFRHAEAEDAALDGYSAKLIAFLLGHKDIDNALYYSKLDVWAQELVDRERLRRREEEQDRQLGVAGTSA